MGGKKVLFLTTKSCDFPEKQQKTLDKYLRYGLTKMHKDSPMSVPKLMPLFSPLI